MRDEITESTESSKSKDSTGITENTESRFNTKISAYGRQRISRPMGMEAPKKILVKKN